MATSSNQSGPPGVSIERLIAELDSPDFSVRENALKSLAKLGPIAEAAISRLAAMLGGLSKPEKGPNPNAKLSWEAIDALAAIGEKALSTLEQLAMSADLDTAERAVTAVGTMSPEVIQKAAPWLLKVVNHRRGTAGMFDGANVREAAARVLGRVPKAAARELVSLLASADGEVCIEVAIALGAVGAAAADAVPYLMCLLDSISEHDSWKLLRVFGQIGSEAHEAVGVLTAHLDARFPDVHRQMAAEALGRIGASAASAAPALIAILSEKDAGRGVVAEAATALGRMGAAAREAVPALELCARHRDPYIRGKAQEALQLVTTAATAA